MKVKAKRFNALRRRKAEKKRERKYFLRQRRLEERKTMSIRRIRKLFPGCELKQMMIGSVPRDMKDRFKSWCANRGYTPAGRIRKFMYDCTIGVIQE